MRLGYGFFQWNMRDFKCLFWLNFVRLPIIRWSTYSYIICAYCLVLQIRKSWSSPKRTSVLFWNFFLCCVGGGHWAVSRLLGPDFSSEFRHYDGSFGGKSPTHSGSKRWSRCQLKSDRALFYFGDDFPPNRNTMMSTVPVFSVILLSSLPDKTTFLSAP